MRKAYARPGILSETAYETTALSCGKTPNSPPGSWHYGSAYDTFTGHLGPALGASESLTGSAGIGFGPGGTSNSYPYFGACTNWVTFNS